MNTQPNTLVNQFFISAINAAASVELVLSNPEMLWEHISLITRHDDQVLFSEPETIPAEYFSRLKLDPKFVKHPDNEQLIGIRTGITDAFCGIASTGSVGILITEGLSSVISMLTRNHIVVLNSKTIVPCPQNVFDKDYLNGRALENSFTLISGPSATADMGPLVRGVHGPGKLHIIVLE